MKIRTLALILFALSTALAQTKTPEAMQWNHRSFSIGGRNLILIGGSMHYFRVPPAEWEAEFRRMHADGFNVVDTVIPWFIHEPEEGKVDFSSLQKYFDLARKYHIYIVARPGPYVCAEADQGGFPRWLSGKGINYRSDSAASRQWAKHWYDEVMPFLARNQVSRGGPVIMVQLENEYGHPQYLSQEEKKEHLRFLWRTASSYGFDIPLMGNDIQFAEDMNDPILSRIYGTVDAYFGSYKELAQMLSRQRDLNPTMPVGAAEYSLADPNATLRTMLGFGTAYLDLYMFRGGSQFDHAAKKYENSSYVVNAPVEEGGYETPAYYPLKLTGYFLRQFGSTLASAEPAPQAPTVDDPDIWTAQWNRQGEGFLFVRSDTGGLARALALKTSAQQHITYHDPLSGRARVIPRYSTMSLGPEQSRLIPLDVPLPDQTTLIYSTADLLGRYAFPGKTWLVFYGDPGQQGEVALSFAAKPAELDRDAIWNDVDREAVYRMQFSDRDRIVALTKGVSLLLLSRQRAYRATEFPVGDESDLVVSGADEIETETSGNSTTLHLQWRQPVGPVTILSSRPLPKVRIDGSVLPVDQTSGARRFIAPFSTPNSDPGPVPVQVASSWNALAAEKTLTTHSLQSLPKLGIWKKGISHYHAELPPRGNALLFQFFTDDYKAVYVNGLFVPEASNRAREAIAGSQYCPDEIPCAVDLYYVDTGRPKEDLGVARMDEEKGLRAVHWLNGKSIFPVDVEWTIQFSSLREPQRSAEDKLGPQAIAYTFLSPSVEGEKAVWRAHLPEVEALIYLNGTYLEHHQPHQHADDAGDHEGIYLPPSMMKKEGNQLLLLLLAPVPGKLDLPVIRPDPASVRAVSSIVLDFSESQAAVP